MRRTAVAVIGFGCAIGVFAAAGTTPGRASAADRNQASGNVTGGGAGERDRGVHADQARGASSSEAETAAADKLETIGTYGVDAGQVDSIIWGMHKLAAEPSGAL